MRRVFEDRHAPPINILGNGSTPPRVPSSGRLDLHTQQSSCGSRMANKLCKGLVVRKQAPRTKCLVVWWNDHFALLTVSIVVDFCSEVKQRPSYCLGFVFEPCQPCMVHTTAAERASPAFSWTSRGECVRLLPTLLRSGACQSIPVNPRRVCFRKRAS